MATPFSVPKISQHSWPLFCAMLFCIHENWRLFVKLQLCLFPCRVLSPVDKLLNYVQTLLGSNVCATSTFFSVKVRPRKYLDLVVKYFQAGGDGCSQRSYDLTGLSSEFPLFMFYYKIISTSWGWKSRPELTEWAHK